jgi:hypothetical protein
LTRSLPVLVLASERTIAAGAGEQIRRMNWTMRSFAGDGRTNISANISEPRTGVWRAIHGVSRQALMEAGKE